MPHLEFTVEGPPASHQTRDKASLQNWKRIIRAEAAIEPGNRIRLPAQWAEALGLQDQVVLVKTDEGILVRPHPKVTWDDIFANRLSARPGDAATAPEVTEVSGDDLLF